MVSESRCYFQLNRRPIAALSGLTARAQFVQHHGKDDDRALDDQLPVEGDVHQCGPLFRTAMIRAPIKVPKTVPIPPRFETSITSERLERSDPHHCHRDGACVEYVARANMSQPLTEEEKESGIHGVYISQAKSSTASFAMPVRFICRFTETSFIMAEDSLAMN